LIIWLVIVTIKSVLKVLEIDFQREIAELKAELIKWIVGVAAGQIVFIVALLK